MRGRKENLELDEGGLWVTRPLTLGNVVSRKLVASEGEATKLGESDKRWGSHVR